MVILAQAYAFMTYVSSPMWFSVMWSIYLARDMPL